ncbi:MAG: T9SS type A sorting domain-containing protein [Bacteroidia bacterium]|nr:T9SS type A sorting domain-containing protein [Bacteroidia bacterium]
MKKVYQLGIIACLALMMIFFVGVDANAQNNRTSSAYTVNPSDAKGCTATANAGTDFSVCSGGIAGLNGSIAGAATSSEWKGGLGTFDPNPFDPQADYYPDPTEYGTTITLWLVTDDPAGSCPSDSDDIAMTIILSPALHPIPPVSFCSPDTSYDLSTISVMDSNNVTGFITYFDGSNPPMPLASSIVSPPIGVPTVYNIFKVTTTTPSCFSIQPVTVTGGATITAASGIDATCTGFCDGQATATVTGGSVPYMYVWSNGDTASTITNLCAGTYTVTTTDVSGCSSSASVVINEPAVSNLPVSSFSFVDNGGGQFVFTNLSTNSTNYSWAFGDGGSDTTSNPTYAYTTNGNFSVTLTASGPCGQDDTTIVVAVITGIGEYISDYGINISPNPASDVLNINLSNAKITIKKVIITDMIGRKTYSKKIASATENVRVDLNKFSEGTYLVQLLSKNNNLVHKILIRK